MTFEDIVERKVSDNQNGRVETHQISTRYFANISLTASTGKPSNRLPSHHVLPALPATIEFNTASSVTSEAALNIASILSFLMISIWLTSTGPTPLTCGVMTLSSGLSAVESARMMSPE
jgi:hypothetical protein